MIKAVVFDLSGVIWRRRPFDKGFFSLLSQTVDLPLGTVRVKYKQVVGRFQTNDLQLDTWLRTSFNLSQPQINEFNLRLKKIFESNYEKNFYLEAIPLLRLLRSNDITVGCLTNSENFLIKLFTKASFFCYFDFKITSIKAGHRKPSQKIYKRIFKIGNWQPKQTILIDNQKPNVDTANKLGIHGIKFESYKKLAPQLDRLIFQKD